MPIKILKLFANIYGRIKAITTKGDLENEKQIEFF